MATPRAGQRLVLDLGTATLRLAMVLPGKYSPDAPAPAIIEMPAVTLVDRERHSVAAVGTQAAALAKGSLPTGVEIVRPMREGMIAAFDPAVALVRQALHEATGGERALRRLTRKPRALYSLPATASDAMRHITGDVLTYAGLGACTPIPATLAAGVGAELPVKSSRLHAICDLGAGVSEIAVLGNGRVLVARSWPFGGDWLDTAIIRAVRRRRGNTITRAMAEEARREFGALDEDYSYNGKPVAVGSDDGLDPAQRRIIARRRNTGTGPLMASVGAGGSFRRAGHNPHSRSGLPEFNPQDVAAGLSDGARGLIEGIALFWEDLDGKMRDGIAAEGLMLTGGAATLPGLAPAIARALSVPVRLAADPAGATIRGLIELGSDPANWEAAWSWPPAWESSL